MASKKSRLLVIDASVARAAGGEDATFPQSKHCRDFLLAVRTICHRMAMTPPITGEWNQHQSRFARAWRVSMEARKKVVRLKIEANDELREMIADTSPAAKGREAILKDMHLIEAALAGDHAIAALDEIVRALFRAAAQSVGVIKPIVWINPGIQEEDAVGWLTRKAKPERHRQLGFDASEESS